MKKLAFLIVGIWSSGVMAKTIYYGTIDGAVRDYYPKAHVTKVVLYNSTATSGIEGNIVERSQRN
ncbi:hypothetical protein Q8344_005337, partial [Vibrio harveyi]|nr:hypothetical protein [Vibrio harveyi]